jgi:hypothetical protein
LLTSNSISHSRSTEGLYAQQDHLRQAVLPDTLPQGNILRVFLHVHPFIGDLIGDRSIQGVVSLSAKSVIVAASMRVWRSSIEFRHLENVENTSNKLEQDKRLELMCTLTADHATLYTHVDHLSEVRIATIAYRILKWLICGASALDNYPSLG